MEQIFNDYIDIYNKNELEQQQYRQKQFNNIRKNIEQKDSEYLNQIQQQQQQIQQLKEQLLITQQEVIQMQQQIQQQNIKNKELTIKYTDVLKELQTKILATKLIERLKLKSKVNIHKFQYTSIIQDQIQQYQHRRAFDHWYKLTLKRQNQRLQIQTKQLVQSNEEEKLLYSQLQNAKLQEQIEQLKQQLLLKQQKELKIKENIQNAIFNGLSEISEVDNINVANLSTKSEDNGIPLALSANDYPNAVHKTPQSQKLSQQIKNSKQSEQRNIKKSSQGIQTHKEKLVSTPLRKIYTDPQIEQNQQKKTLANKIKEDKQKKIQTSRQTQICIMPLDSCNIEIDNI